MVLTLHNPQSRNAMDTGVYAAGVEALNAAGDNRDIRSVVIVGWGDTFSAGGDLRPLQENRTNPSGVQEGLLDALHLFIDTVNTFPKPIVAAVEGAALGSAFSLVLACDMIVAAQGAIFALSHGHVGLTPDGGATWQLARALPRNLAAEISLLGDGLTAERLHALGLVNRLSNPGMALSDALLLAETLNQRAPNVVEATKELLAAAPRASLAEQLHAERVQFLKSLGHANGGIGIAAFLHKQTPDFE